MLVIGQTNASSRMEGISDIRMVGIDTTRPPKILKEPYIELFFKLTHKAPKKWCDDFNTMFSKSENQTKINAAEGIIVEAWVRKASEIQALFELIKKGIIDCNLHYIARIEKEKLNSQNNGVTTSSDEDSEQGRLNKIIENLQFEIIQN